MVLNRHAQWGLRIAAMVVALTGALLGIGLLEGGWRVVSFAVGLAVWAIIEWITYLLVRNADTPRGRREAF